MRGKLPFPSWTCVTPVTVNITDGLTEEGEPKVVLSWSGKCNYSEKTRFVMDKDRKLIQLNGTVIIEGDIAPNLAVISGGNVVINELTREINSGSRPRNPDGSVHHTKLELI